MTPIPADVIAAAWSRAAETVRQRHPGLVPTTFDLIWQFKQARTPYSPRAIREACARVGLRLADG